MNKELFLQEFKKLDLKGKNATQLYNEISSLAMKYIQASEKPNRSASYLSIEFLIGRVFYNNLLELGVLQEVSEILKEKGVNIALFEEIEDAALGNGGLGGLPPLYGFGRSGRDSAVRLRYPL